MTRGPGALIVHGHFYQPPRENPWTGAIETQPSAAPFPNWNARIAAECYHPNGRARLLDARGRIGGLVNNYRFLSFNVGPTLLAWLAAHAPEAYAAIRAADRESAAAVPRHGNAIAQGYNHAILPLASRRDKVTQVRWGLADFRYRFGRDAEALWLPETAVDGETLAVLAEQGLRYVLLAPEQAQRVRPGEHVTWHPAERALDVRRAYRIRLGGSGDGAGSLAALFFHGSLSRGIAFEGLAQSATALADRVAEVLAPPLDEPRPAGASAGTGGVPERVLLLCCDGETFGHHQRFAEMGLARLFEVECPARGIPVTNPARYLAAHPPAWEVELRAPSSWSCPHGVARWAEDCGCTTGARPGWHQRWRAPLRAGLGRLRAACDRIFEVAGGRLLVDPWGARDDYIQVLLDPGEAAREAFLARHARGAGRVERAAILRLLEMQRFGLLMDTSCAWFFADIAGIEATQNLRYAAAAIEMARPFTDADLEAELLAALAGASSNDPAWHDGAQVYTRAVRPTIVRPDRAVHRHAVAHLLGEPPAPSVSGYRLEALAAARDTIDGIEIALGGARGRWPPTAQDVSLGYLAVRTGPFDVRAHVFAWEGEAAVRRALAEVAAEAPGAGGRAAHLAERLAERFGPSRRLADLLPDDQQQVLEALLRAATPPVGGALEPLYEARRGGLLALAEAGLPLPEEDRALSAVVLRARVTAALRALPAVPEDADLAPALRAATEARALGLRLELPEARDLLGDRLRTALAAFDAPAGGQPAGVPGLTACRAAEAIGEAARRLDLPLDPAPMQEALFPILAGPLPGVVERAAAGDADAYAVAAALLRLAHAHGLAVDDLRARLAPLEAHLAADPRAWP